MELDQLADRIDALTRAVMMLVDREQQPGVHEEHCNAHCCSCDATMPRSFEQSAARHNERVGFTTAGAMESFQTAQNQWYQAMLGQSHLQAMDRFNAQTKSVQLLYRSS